MACIPARKQQTQNGELNFRKMGLSFFFCVFPHLMLLPQIRQMLHVTRFLPKSDSNFPQSQQIFKESPSPGCNLAADMQESDPGDQDVGRIWLADAIYDIRRTLKVPNHRKNCFCADVLEQ